MILDDIFERIVQREEMLESLRRESLKRQSRFVSDREQRERERELKLREGKSCIVSYKAEGKEKFHYVDLKNRFSDVIVKVVRQLDLSQL